jgi:hypothetical protein
MKIRLAVTSAVFLLTALAVALLLPRFDRHEEQQEIFLTARAVGPAATGLLPVPAQAASAAPRLPEEALLLRSFSSKGDARNFVLEAWKRPELGGRRYASRLVQRCIGLRELGPTHDAELASQVPEADLLQAMEALKFLQLRCGQFSGEELSSHSLTALMRAEDGRQDALSVLSNRLIRSADRSDERSRALKAVLDRQDPLLLDELGPRLALHSDGDGSYLFFRGVRYPLRTEPVLYGAFYLVPCAFGMPCGETDMDLARQCALGSGCYKDRFEFARVQVGNDPERYRALIAAYEDLVAAIRAADVDAFLPPPSGRSEARQ